MKKAFITTGTADFLLHLKEKNPSYSLVFMTSEDHALLYHETFSKTVFSAPRIYKVIDEEGVVPDEGFAVFHYIPVSKEEKPAFEHAVIKRPRTMERADGFIAIRVLRPVKKDLYVIFTCWEKEIFYRHWEEEGDFLQQTGIKKNWEISQIMNYPNHLYRKEYLIGIEKEG